MNVSINPCNEPSPLFWYRNFHGDGEPDNALLNEDGNKLLNEDGTILVAEDE